MSLRILYNTCVITDLSVFFEVLSVSAVLSTLIQCFYLYLPNAEYLIRLFKPKFIFMCPNNFVVHLIFP